MLKIDAISEIQQSSTIWISSRVNKRSRLKLLKWSWKKVCLRLKVAEKPAKKVSATRTKLWCFCWFKKETKKNTPQLSYLSNFKTNFQTALLLKGKKNKLKMFNNKPAATICISRNINKKFWEAQMKQNSWIKSLFVWSFLILLFKLCHINFTKAQAERQREIPYCEISHTLIMAFNHNDFVIKHLEH